MLLIQIEAPHETDLFPGNSRPACGSVDGARECGRCGRMVGNQGCQLITMIIAISKIISIFDKTRNTTQQVPS